MPFFTLKQRRNYMQYSRLLLVGLLSTLSTAVSAQQYQDFSMEPKGRKVIKSDTIVRSRPIAEATLPAGPTMMLPAPGISAIKKVPLAGQQSYYGSMTDYVNTFVRQYFVSHDRTLSVVKGRGASKFPIIEAILTQNHIPKELKYLSVIESALNNQAVSGAGAVGPWQLMDFTGRQMGLTVSGRRDDRTDWHKSTAAAAKYLNILYKQLDDWLLVVAAYNCGPVPVQRAIEKTGSRNFWDIKKYLPRETQGHVLAFIATASIFENMNRFIGQGGLPDDYVFENERVANGKPAGPPKPVFSPEELARMVIVRIKDPIDLDMLCVALAVDKRTMSRWNPDYDLFVYSTYSEDYYSLRIPKDKLENFIEQKTALVNSSKTLYDSMHL